MSHWGRFVSLAGLKWHIGGRFMSVAVLKCRIGVDFCQ